MNILVFEKFVKNKGWISYGSRNFRVYPDPEQNHSGSEAVGKIYEFQGWTFALSENEQIAHIFEEKKEQRASRSLSFF